MARNTRSSEHEQARGFYVRALLDGEGSGAWNMVFAPGARHGLAELLSSEERTRLDKVADTLRKKRDREVRSRNTRFDSPADIFR